MRLSAVLHRLHLPSPATPLLLLCFPSLEPGSNRETAVFHRLHRPPLEAIAKQEAIATPLLLLCSLRLLHLLRFDGWYTDADKQIEEVKKALYMMYEEYLEIHDISVRESTSLGSSCGGNTGLEKTPLGTGWEAFGEFIKNDDLEKPEKSELDTYLEEGVYREHGQKGMNSFKALEWWCVHKEKYRVLSKMAMDVLAIPVSTVASESTFSAGGRVIDAYRSSLGKETVQKLICGADWIRHLYDINKKLKNEEMPTEVLLPTGKSNT